MIEYHTFDSIASIDIIGWVFSLLFFGINLLLSFFVTAKMDDFRQDLINTVDACSAINNAYIPNIVVHGLGSLFVFSRGFYVTFFCHGPT